MGISTGRASAIAVALAPMATADPRTAPVRTPKPVGSASSSSTSRPQRVTCSSWAMNIIARKPAATSTKVHHEVPSPVTETGTEYAVSSTSPASGTRRRVQAKRSVASRVRAPPTSSRACTGGTLGGTGAS